MKNAAQDIHSEEKSGRTAGRNRHGQHPRTAKAQPAFRRERRQQRPGTSHGEAAPRPAGA